MAAVLIGISVLYLVMWVVVYSHVKKARWRRAEGSRAGFVADGAAWGMISGGGGGMISGGGGGMISDGGGGWFGGDCGGDSSGGGGHCGAG
jgi:hypothetical protein